MSVVVALGFPEETLMVSDSRISFSNSFVPPKDELRKLYQIGNSLGIGFTSQHVTFTLSIIQQMTNYALKKSKSMSSLYLLDKLPKVANYHYRKLASLLNIEPAMELVYAGTVNDRILSTSSKFWWDLLSEHLKNKGSSNIPPKIAKAIYDTANGETYLEPPVPVLMKQVFPSGNCSDILHFGFIVSGSGSVIAENIQKEGLNLFFSDSDIPMRLSILNLIMKDFLEKTDVKSVGGFPQMLRIRENGVTPIYFNEGKFDDNGKETKTQTVRFENGEWVVTDHTKGTETRIKSNPLSIDPNKKLHLSESSWSDF